MVERMGAYLTTQKSESVPSTEVVKSEVPLEASVETVNPKEPTQLAIETAQPLETAPPLETVTESNINNLPEIPLENAKVFERYVEPDGTKVEVAPVNVAETTDVIKKKNKKKKNRV